MKLKAVIFVILTAVTLPSLGVEVLPVEGNPQTLLLSGELKRGDLQKIIAAVRPPNPFPKYFTLNSPGGDVAEAMKIGQFIRDTATGTFVTNICASACVFILVAGTSQSALPAAAIGLHRPYFSPEAYKGLSLPETEVGYRKLIRSARSYLMEMEVPSAYIEQMFSVSSDDVYFMTREEKEQLLRRPSAYDEWIRARCNPPSADEWELFERRGFNVFDQFDDSPPLNPYFVEFISKLNRSQACEEQRIHEVRKETMGKYIGKK